MARKHTDVALMRASILIPFLDRLSRANRDAVLRRLNMTEDNLTSNSRFLAAEAVYDVVARCADLTDNKNFGIEAGLALDVTAWPPFREAACRPVNLIEFLSRFAANVSQYATSTRYVLEFDAEDCTFRQLRTFRPKSAPEQADAFNIGTLIVLLRSAVGERWDVSRTQLQLCAPELIDIHELVSARKMKGDRMGVACRFPMMWLWEECSFVARNASDANVANEQLPKELKNIVEQLIQSGIPSAEIDTSRVAKSLGVSPRMLRERLRKIGTNLRNVLDASKRREAERLLGQADVSVAQAAEQLGYNEAANFTRAFRRLTGKSPRDYKREIAGNQ